MVAAFSHTQRLLICDNCGAPFEVPITGGQAQCRYCRAVTLFEARREAPEAAHPAGVPDEEARLAMLRAQVGDPTRDDANSLVAAFPEMLATARKGIAATDEGLTQWTAARAQLRASGPSTRDLDEARLHAATLLVRGGLTARGDFVRLRAILETTLELVTAPTRRHDLYCTMASMSIREGDLDAAEHWLASADSHSDVLFADTGYRTARASLAMALGDFRGMLAVLGERHDAHVPIHSAGIPLATLLRAHALDALGRPLDADKELEWVALQRWSSGNGLAAAVAIAEANRFRHLAEAPMARLLAKGDKLRPFPFLFAALLAIVPSIVTVLIVLKVAAPESPLAVAGAIGIGWFAVASMTLAIFRRANQG